MRLAVALLLLCASTAAAQDQSPAAGPRPDRVQVTPGVAEAEVGQTIRFTATAFDAAGAVIDAKPSAWFAAPFDVGGADDQGLVTFFAPGEVKVGAIVNGKPGWATVRIRPQESASIAIAPLAAPLVPGAVARLEARTFTKDGIPREGVPVTWSVEGAAATVDAAGVVTAVAPGRAIVRATSGKGTGTVAVAVAGNTVRALAVEPKVARVRTGDVVRFTARGDRRPLSSVQWSVAGNGAAIDADGGFVAEKAGTFLVTATHGTRVATASVVVEARDVQRALEVVGRTPAEEFQFL
jgi:plastocyanin